MKVGLDKAFGRPNAENSEKYAFTASASDHDITSILPDNASGDQRGGVVVRLYASADVHVTFDDGDQAALTDSGMLLPAGLPELFTAGGKSFRNMQLIGNSGSGTIWVSVLQNGAAV